MVIALMVGLLTACSESAEEDTTPEEPKKKDISCLDACKMIQADNRKGPPFIQFHWKTQGGPEYERCFEAAIQENKIPAEMKCKEKAIGKCETSCKKMTEREQK